MASPYLWRISRLRPTSPTSSVLPACNSVVWGSHLAFPTRWAHDLLLRVTDVQLNCMDLRGFEPLTFSMPLRRAPNCATGPHNGHDYSRECFLTPFTAPEISRGARPEFIKRLKTPINHLRCPTCRPFILEPMKLEGTQHINAPRIKVFEYFTDAHFVSQCAPGVRSDTPRCRRRRAWCACRPSEYA